jgi:hydroxymethylbilane synthase
MKLGTRGSQLARWQAGWVRDRLAAQGVRAEIVVLTTRGDAEVDRPLHELEGKGFFTKEIEDALLDGRIDVAVHSLKDLPTTLPPGLALGAIPARHDPREALVNGRSLSDLPAGTRVGTSSLRRIAQVRFLRPDLEVVPLRGNVPTRVRKVETHDGLDAALLAIAGLERLGLGAKGSVIDPLDVMPAPGQGALGLEIRANDRATRTPPVPMRLPRSVLCSRRWAAGVRRRSRPWWRAAGCMDASQIGTEARSSPRRPKSTAPHRNRQARRSRACSRPKARAPYSPDECTIPDSSHAAPASHPGAASSGAGDARRTVAAHLAAICHARRRAAAAGRVVAGRRAAVRG